MWLLTVDGGGSKTLAKLTNTQSGQSFEAQAGAASLTNDFSLALSNINQLSETLCQQAGIQSHNVIAVMGLAGAGNPQQHLQATQQLAKQYAKFLLTTDARTSLYGANGGKPVLVVALGTGSVAMRLLPDGTEQQIGGWGFNIGDEGGGAWLGKQAVRELLWQVDSQAGITSALLLAIANKIGDTPEVLLPWLKTATASDFATFAPLVLNFSGKCQVADELLSRHIAQTELLIKTGLEQYNLPVVLLGGLALPTAERLSPNYKKLLQKAQGNALDGAFILASQLAKHAVSSGKTNDN